MATVAMPSAAPGVSDIAKALSSNLLKRNFLEGRPYREDPSKEVVRTPHAGNPNLPPPASNGVDAKKAALDALNSMLLNKDWKQGRPEQPVLIQWPKVKRDATGALHPETSPCSSSASSPRSRNKNSRRNARRNRKNLNLQTQGTGMDEVVEGQEQQQAKAGGQQRPGKPANRPAGRENDLFSSPKDQNRLEKAAAAAAAGQAYMPSINMEASVPVPRTPDRLVSWPAASSCTPEPADGAVSMRRSFAFEDHREMIQCNPLFLDEDEQQEHFYALPVRVCEVACQTEDLAPFSPSQPSSSSAGEGAQAVA